MPWHSGSQPGTITILLPVIDPLNIPVSEAHIFCNQVQTGLMIAKVWPIDRVLWQLLNFVIQQIQCEVQRCCVINDKAVQSLSGIGEAVNVRQKGYIHSLHDHGHNILRVIVRLLHVHFSNRELFGLLALLIISDGGCEQFHIDCLHSFFEEHLIDRILGPCRVASLGLAIVRIGHHIQVPFIGWKGSLMVG